MTDMTVDTYIPTQFKMASKANKIYYVTAKMSINSLQEKSEAGDTDCSFAVYDFYESIKNPNYKIQLLTSQKLLGNLGLLDGKETVHQATREAFNQHN